MFTRLCKPKPNEKNPIIANILEMQKEIDIGRDTNTCQDSVIQIDADSHILLSHAARIAFSQSVLYWTDLLSFAQAQSISQEHKSDFQLVVEPTPQTFAHRLQIESISIIPELGCICTASRDGLVQLWAGPHPAPQLKF